MGFLARTKSQRCLTFAGTRPSTAPLPRRPPAVARHLRADDYPYS